MAATLPIYFYEYAQSGNIFTPVTDIILENSTFTPAITTPHSPDYENDIVAQGWSLTRKIGYKHTKHLKANIYARTDMKVPAEYHYLVVFRNKDDILVMVTVLRQVVDMFGIANFTGVLFSLNDR